MIDELFEKNKVDETETVISGDLNIDHLSNSKEITKRLKDLLSSYKLKNMINETTRGKSSLDYFITNMKNTKGGTINHHISDHLGTYLLCKQNNDKQRKNTSKTITYRNLKDESNHENMAKQLEDIEWNEILNNSDDINTKCDKVMIILMNCYNQNYPTKQKTIVERKTKKQWITNEILEDGKTLKKLFHETRAREFLNISKLSNLKFGMNEKGKVTAKVKSVK
uniref:Endonuclease/exonuclease/phosphatase domain-containing protein n=1 Tax=Cacopsylla melanoneura TaxID=428564 RepID=A0A8D8ZFT9_9HEMI